VRLNEREHAFHIDQRPCVEVEQAGLEKAVVATTVGGPPEIGNRPDSVDLIRRAPHHPGIDRRRFLLTSLAGALAGPLAAKAQQMAKLYRIGLLIPLPPTALPHIIEGFRAGLRDLGYEEGKNLQIETRSAEGPGASFPSLATDLVNQGVDVIVASTVPAIRAAQQATTRIPIVMTNSSDPVRVGLISSLSRPGGNTTGLASLTQDLAPKRLEFLSEAVPTMRTVAVLFNPDNPVVQDELHRTQAAGRLRPVQVRPFEVRTATDLEIAFSGIGRERPQGLIVVPDPLTLLTRRQIVEFSRRSGLPAIYGAVEFVQAGGLMSYGTDFVAHFRRAAAYVDLILKGTKPDDLPVEQPTKFQLVINLKTAKALGLTIPPSLLARADRVIE
jgi:ABC-type uncharacterized transport system substrate-binding protein